MVKSFRFYHKVGRSFYPLWTTLSIGGVFSSIVVWAHYGTVMNLIFSLFCLILNILLWCDTVCMEAMCGNHLIYLQDSLKFSFGLFLLSEVMFFFGIFWVFFDSALNPSVELGCQWPPVGIMPINPYGIPLLNTVILLSSGMTATYSHYKLLQKSAAAKPLVMTLVLAACFIYAQYMEYSSSTFSMSDSVYGSIFFFGTGFHGFHVIFGFFFLLFNLYRLLNYHFTRSRHISYELALLYWHFVDVIWLFLYVIFYYWSY